MEFIWIFYLRHVVILRGSLDLTRVAFWCMFRDFTWQLFWLCIWHSALQPVWYLTFHLASGILSDIFCDIFWHSVWHFSCMLSDMYLGMLYVILLRFGLGFAFLVHIIFFRFIEVACKPCHNGMIMTLSIFHLTYLLTFSLHILWHSISDILFRTHSGSSTTICSLTFFCHLMWHSFWHCIWQGGCKLSARPREPVSMGRRTRRRRRRRRSNLT